MKNLISIIIPSYNSSKTIYYTLDSIKKQNGEYIKEIIIVDSSDDGSFERLRSEYNNSKYIFIDAGIRLMPAIVRNIGAEKSSAKVLLFLDSDIILSDDYVEKLVQYYRKGFRAGSGAITIPSFQIDKPVVVAQYYLQLNEYIPFGKVRKRDFMPGCNFFCDRDVFFKSGMFPLIRAAEDTLLGLKIKKMTEIWFIPTISVGHIFREDKQGFMNNQFLLGKFTRIYKKEISGNIIYTGFITSLLSPLFFIAKSFLISSRIVKTGVNHTFRFFSVFHLFLAGLYHWTRGFVLGGDENLSSYFRNEFK